MGKVRDTKQALGILLAAGAVALLSIGCGQQNPPPPPVATTSAGTCTGGSVYSASYGCIAQGGCPMGYGLYNNSCVPVTTNGAMTNGTMTNGTMTNGAMMNCGMGSVSTQYGCMPQGNCPAGYGMYNGSCVPATQAGTTGFCSAGMTQNYSQCVPAGSTTTQGGYPSSYGSGYYGYGYGYLEQNRPQ